MSYYKATECFQDIHNWISRRDQRVPLDSALFDLANGLTQLTEAIEADLNKLHREIQTVKRQTE